VAIRKNPARNIPKPKNAIAKIENQITPEGKKLSTLTLAALKELKSLWKNVPICNTNPKYLCYGISLMSFLMTIDEYREYLSSGLYINNAFSSNGKVTEEMRPQFKEYYDRSGDILLNLTHLASWSEKNKGPGKTTPQKLLQAIRTKVCEQSTGDNFKVGYHMVRYILATNHYSLPWIC
jgi:hypothetical protein